MSSSTTTSSSAAASASAAAVPQLQDVAAGARGPGRYGSGGGNQGGMLVDGEAVAVRAVGPGERCRQAVFALLLLLLLLLLRGNGRRRHLRRQAVPGERHPIHDVAATRCCCAAGSSCNSRLRELSLPRGPLDVSAARYWRSLGQLKELALALLLLLAL